MHLHRRNLLDPRTLVVAQLLAASGSAYAQTTERVSVSTGGTQGNSTSYTAPQSLSGDGNLVVFTSYTTNLVAGDSNGCSDVFLRDWTTGTTVCVSVDPGGAVGNQASQEPAISGDGLVVAFRSAASNLVAGDTNNVEDIFVRDRVTGVTERVSVDSSGNESDAWSFTPALSADGRFVVFLSGASNLVAGDANHQFDIFVHDRVTGATERVSVDSSENEGNLPAYSPPSISADGRCVAFASVASNMVAGDANGAVDVFVRDLVAGTTERVSVDSAGVEGNLSSYEPSISADGTKVAFWSTASNLVAGDSNGFSDVFVRDRTAGTIAPVSVDSSGALGNGDSERPVISADGRVVAFQSRASNLDAGDGNGASDVFVRDLAKGATWLESVDYLGGSSSGPSVMPALSANGLVIAFDSDATDLVLLDTNGFHDAFVRTECRTSWANYGVGLAGTLGIPSLTVDADPVLGTTIHLLVGNSLGASTPGLLIAGASAASMPYKKGTLLVGDLYLIVGITIGAAGESIELDVPSDADCGAMAFAQVLELDAAAPKNLSMTPGLELVLGY